MNRTDLTYSVFSRLRIAFIMTRVEAIRQMVNVGGRDALDNSIMELLNLGSMQVSCKIR